jgi:hypothetical protein
VGIGASVVVGALVAYYAIPVFVVVISLGEICPYSPSGIGLCRQSAPTKLGPAAAAPRTPSALGKLCKKPGVRYAGTTPQGAEVCLTLTRDSSKWLEIGFRFVRASGCPRTTGTTYYEGRVPLNGPGRIAVPGFTAAIRGARAAGVLRDSEACGSKTFKWSAKRIVGA